jgi:hypothetical protein
VREVRRVRVVCARGVGVRCTRAARVCERTSSIYSDRSAIAAGIRDARNAGMTHANETTISRKAMTIISVSGSLGVTW